jgi:hypothetical protein
MISPDFSKLPIWKNGKAVNELFDRWHIPAFTPPSADFGLRQLAPVSASLRGLAPHAIWQNEPTVPSVRRVADAPDVPSEG